MEESHNGPGKGYQAVIPHAVASLLGAGTGPAQLPALGQAAVLPVLGEPGLRQHRDLPREHLHFRIFSPENTGFSKLPVCEEKDTF